MPWIPAAWCCIQIKSFILHSAAIGHTPPSAGTLTCTFSSIVRVQNQEHIHPSNLFEFSLKTLQLCCLSCNPTVLYVASETCLCIACTLKFADLDQGCHDSCGSIVLHALRFRLPHTWGLSVDMKCRLRDKYLRIHVSQKPWDHQSLRLPFVLPQD